MRKFFQETLVRVWGKQMGKEKTPREKGIQENPEEYSFQPILPGM